MENEGAGPKQKEAALLTASPALDALMSRLRQAKSQTDSPGRPSCDVVGRTARLCLALVASVSSMVVWIASSKKR